MATIDKLPPQNAGKWIGRPVHRIEDQDLLTGAGRFTDDVSLPNHAHVAFVRSPHAHARILSINVSAARATPGVIAVLTGSDVNEEGLDPVPFLEMHKRPDGKGMTVPPRRAITSDVARFVGDPVAIVVAETRNQAMDAAELVDVAWDPLPSVVSVELSARKDAPVIWPPAFTEEHGNLAAYYRKGDGDAVSRAIAEAKYVVRLRVVNQRVVANPIEPRSLAAYFDAEGRRFTLYCPTQNVHYVRTQLATVFKLPEDRFHVLSSHVGGAFGTRGYIYPEHAALCFAARRTGRAVKWLAGRSENFLADVHGRDNVSTAELALDERYRFIGLRIRTLANVGAYISNVGAVVPALSGARAPTGVYAIPHVDHEVRMMLTNSAPVDAYRGAGRPEMGYLVERLVNRAATDLGIDPIELRLVNLVTSAQMPYTNAVGFTYDCGDFERILRGVLTAADWPGFPARRAEAKRRGKLYGRGISCYVEVTGSLHPFETVRMSALAVGEVTAISGTQPIGQGIATAYAQIVADHLGITPQSVRIVQGDSDLLESGWGAGGSRGLQVGGSAIFAGVKSLVDAGRLLAAKELEVAAADIEFQEGRYCIAGTDRSIGFFELAGKQPEARIDCVHTETVKGQTWPNGCQVCEAEVDPETGVVRIARLAAVDDIGNVINPLIAEGQVQGGIAQGIGQALIEHSVYDEHGQLLTGSFMDYAMPRADLIPDLHTIFDESIPTRQNPLGAKGVGEAGCHGSMPAVVSAVLDALAERGVKELDMPLTPEKVWCAAREH